jgi:chromosome segregation ATPase
MKELYEEYKRSLSLLRQRHEKLSGEIKMYDKRVALLEEEMDELCEAMSMMRPYLEA